MPTSTNNKGRLTRSSAIKWCLTHLFSRLHSRCSVLAIAGVGVTDKRSKAGAGRHANYAVARGVDALVNRRAKAAAESHAIALRELRHEWRLAAVRDDAVHNVEPSPVTRFIKGGRKSVSDAVFGTKSV